MSTIVCEWPAGSSRAADDLLPAGGETTGFHLMMPPGWVRYPVDAEGKAALVAQATARMRELSRPDLDAQVRSMIQSYWQTLFRRIRLRTI